LLHAREYAFLSAKDALASGIVSDPVLEVLGRPEEIGFLLCVEDDGRKVTALTGNADWLHMSVDAGPEAIAGLEIPEGMFPVARDGWPDDWGE